MQPNSLEGLLHATLPLFLSRCFSSFTLSHMSIAFLFLYRTSHRGRKIELVQYLMLLIIKMRSWKLKSRKFKLLQKFQEMTGIAFAISYCMRWGPPGAVFDKPSLPAPFLTFHSGINLTVVSTFSTVSRILFVFSVTDLFSNPVYSLGLHHLKYKV